MMMKPIRRVLGRAPLRSLLWLVCVCAPLVWMQLARGYSIPSREPPQADAAAEVLHVAESTPEMDAADVELDAASTTDDVSVQQALPGEPLAAQATSDQAAAERAVAAPAPGLEGAAAVSAPELPGAAAMSAPELEDAGATSASQLDDLTASAAPRAQEPAAAAQLGALATAVESTQSQTTPDVTEVAAPAPAEQAGAAAVAEATDASPAAEAVTILVSEPLPESQAHAAPAGGVIAEVLPLQPVPVKPKRAARKARRATLALAEVVPSSAAVRALGEAQTQIAAGHGDVPALIGGRGVAARADLGRQSPLSGAAADVFATGHHVAALPNCAAYADNPYFREDAFGKTLRLSCE